MNTECTQCGMPYTWDRFHPVVFCWLYAAGYNPEEYVQWAAENVGKKPLDVSDPRRYIMRMEAE